MTRNPSRILIADDQPDVLEALRLLLKAEGFQIDMVTSPQEVLPALNRKEYDLVLIDLNYTRDTTSGKEGLDLLAKIQEADPVLPVVVMTAWVSTWASPGPRCRSSLSTRLISAAPTPPPCLPGVTEMKYRFHIRSENGSGA